MRTLRKYAFPFITSIALVFLVDALTNGVTEKYLFDSNVYIGIAERGFAKDILVAPFVYRYVTPLLAGSLHQYTGISIYKSFKLLTYIGLVSQLFGIYLLVQMLTRSRKGAYVSMLVVAFSMYNLKYLLFDVYRADALAYTIVLLSSWLALKKRFLPLIFVTVIGLQVREFTAVPLFAYLAVRLQHDGIRKSLRELIFSFLALSVAVGLPRLLIPIVANEQDVQNLGQLLYLLSLWKRDINLIYVCLAYFLPFLILYRPSKFQEMGQRLSPEQWHFLLYFLCLVFLLIIVGGTDMERFASYFFLPMAVFVGLLVKNQSLASITIVVFLQFIFNRIWLLFPIWDYELFANFYGGWSVVINASTLWRYLELTAYAIIGNVVIHINHSNQNIQKPAMM